MKLLVTALGRTGTAQWYEAEASKRYKKYSYLSSKYWDFNVI